MSINVLASTFFFGFAGILLKRRRTFLTIGFFVVFLLELITWPPAIWKAVEYLHTSRIDRWWGLYLFCLSITRSALAAVLGLKRFLLLRSVAYYPPFLHTILTTLTALIPLAAIAVAIGQTVSGKSSTYTWTGLDLIAVSLPFGWIYTVDLCLAFTVLWVVFKLEGQLKRRTGGISIPTHMSLQPISSRSTTVSTNTLDSKSSRPPSPLKATSPTTPSKNNLLTELPNPPRSPSLAAEMNLDEDLPASANFIKCLVVLMVFDIIGGLAVGVNTSVSTVLRPLICSMSASVYAMLSMVFLRSLAGYIHSRRYGQK
ncbi:hypothetical protein HK097_004707 [Rhizophlyctis rosea]|uniref:Uncharacterized protein n=1 Tax=Rhizophlyctis rosea TaxID=64517 RepID=A0AAD5S189_9FUNG|nr:hypothetical protein HK097_004707 [Rhizophlyctis rosea]